MWHCWIYGVLLDEDEGDEGLLFDDDEREKEVEDEE